MSHPCEHCGGSGVLNVITASMCPGHWDDRPYVSACHCPMGLTMREVGLDG